MKSFLKINYSALPGWIANLGVVPLLLFAAFLLLPILVFLAFLLFLVTLVFETISQLLNIITCSRCWFTYFNKMENLRPSPPLVKELLGITCLFFISPIPTPLAEVENQGLTHTLTIGQILEIERMDMKRFTLGNKKVVKTKPLTGRSGLLIKGESLGHTDLLIWTKSRKRPIKHQIYVVRKTKYLKLQTLNHSYSQLGLKGTIIGEKLFVSGHLKLRRHYQSFSQISRHLESDVDLSGVNLEPSLKLNLYSEFLEALHENNLFDLDCEWKSISIYCKGSKQVRKSLQKIEELYLIQWIPEKLLVVGKQFQITLILQQYENSSGEAFNFGLSQVDGNLGQILLEDPLSLIAANSIKLKHTEFRSTTLAHPKLIGRFNQEIKIRLGQEIPFLQSVSNGVATQSWRFAGLSIDLTLKPHTDRVLVHYKTNLSTPSERGINQNSQESSILISPKENQALFDIGFKNSQKNQSKLPYLSAIPLLGTLFSGNEKGSSYKKVLCLIKIEEI